MTNEPSTHGFFACSRANGNQLNATQYTSLTQVCRQIRNEYRPIYLTQAKMYPEVEKLQQHLDLYYPLKSCDQKGTAHLGIICIDFDFFVVDIAPFLKLDIDRPVRGKRCYQQELLSVRNFHESLDHLLRHKNGTWISDMQVGKVEEIRVWFKTHPTLMLVHILFTRSGAPQYLEDAGVAKNGGRYLADIGLKFQHQRNVKVLVGVAQGTGRETKNYIRRTFG